MCAEFTFPDPSMYDLLTVGGVTSGNTSNSSSSESPRLPWLQMEYEGPRTLDELHCNIQVSVHFTICGELCSRSVHGLCFQLDENQVVVLSSLEILSFSSAPFLIFHIY